MSDWKRKFLTISIIVIVAGMLWETNDFFEENQEHPWIAPQNQLANVKYDEFGDPIASQYRPRSLPYARIWSSPITRVGFCFLIALLIGSLFRSLVKGSMALLALLVVSFFLIGQDNVFDLFRNRQPTGLFSNALAWIGEQSRVAGSYIWSSIATSTAAIIGLVLGLLE